VSAKRNVSVIGLGYLGLIQAIVLAESGHSVTAVDTDKIKVDALRMGFAPFFEPELQERLGNLRSSGNLTFSDNYEGWVESTEIHFLCVGTPLAKGKNGLDASFLFDAVDSISNGLIEDAIIVGRSTVEVGTAERLKQHLSSRVNKRFHMTWNPEFLSEGSAFRESFHPERIVLGVDSEFSKNALLDLYGDKIYNGAPILTMDLASSELVKVAANSFLAMKISFINGIAGVAESVGADTHEIALALGLDSRIGKKFLKSGLGFGGGCLPKDTIGLASSAASLGQGSFSRLLEMTLEINRGRVLAAKDTILSLAVTDVPMTVCVLGATFKPNTDDLRGSQALELIQELLAAGAIVRVHDPVALEKIEISNPNLMKFDSSRDAILGADIVVLATEWEEYLTIDPTSLPNDPGSRMVLDLRNFLDKRAWADSGWKILSILPHPLKNLDASLSTG
jgi:UDPglucose 6-dehydrogenase